MKVSIFAVQFPISLKIAANLKHIQKYAQMAHPGDLVLFPEGAISGYSSDLSFLDQIDQAELAAALDDLGQLAQNLGSHLWVGSLISEDGFWFNAACGFGPAGESYQYRKINLAHHERGILTPGNDLPIKRNGASAAISAPGGSECAGAGRHGLRRGRRPRPAGHMSMAQEPH